MSLLTRCPACETLYRLVPDQLRISQGWVKCGQCSEIFDASQHLIELALEEEEAVGKEDVPADPLAVTLPAPERSTPGVVETIVEPLAAQVTTGSGQESIPVDDPMIVAVPDASCVVQHPEISPETIGVLPPVDKAVLVGAPATVEATEAVTFMLEPRTGRLIGAAWIRSALWLALLLLLAALLGQWFYWERDRLAATHPDWKPLLERFCVPIGCSVHALRRIEAIALDVAAFNKLNEDTYRLAFVIKNQSTLPLALPSVELSLTDVQEQTIVRRVLSRGELFDVALELPTGKEYAISRIVRIKHSEPGQRIVGYRLLAFYP